MLESRSICHQGLVREGNEDSFVENSVLGLWVVADGVGGNGNGDVASQLATQTIERKVRQGADLVGAIAAADAAIVDAITNNEDYRNMATTAVACRFDDQRFELAWVGDSRAYLIDATGICQISSDHNMANSLFNRGELTQEQASRHPGRHELTQALGQMTLSKIPISLGELHDGDYLLLCTDGLYGVLSEQKIVQTISRSASLSAACDELLNQVLALGAPDNVTFCLIQYRKHQEKLAASDFATKTFRLPVARCSYLDHCKSRSWLLGLLAVSIILLYLFV